MDDLDYPEDQIRMTLDLRPDSIEGDPGPGEVRLHEIVLEPGQTAWAPSTVPDGAWFGPQEDRWSLLYKRAWGGEVTVEARKVDA